MRAENNGGAKISEANPMRKWKKEVKKILVLSSLEGAFQSGSALHQNAWKVPESIGCRREVSLLQDNH